MSHVICQFVVIIVISGRRIIWVIWGIDVSGEGSETQDTVPGGKVDFNVQPENEITVCDSMYSVVREEYT